MDSFNEFKEDISKRFPNIIGTPTLVKVKFKDKLFNKTFTFNSLAPGYVSESLERYNERRRNRKVKRIVRKKLIEWYIKEKEEELEVKKIFSTTTIDGGYAIAWYNYIKKYPLNNNEKSKDFYHIYSISNDGYFISQQASSLISCYSNESIDDEDIANVSSFTSRIVKECQVWFGVGERIAIVEYKLGKYYKFFYEYRDKVEVLMKEVEKNKKRFCMMIKTSSYTRKMIRNFVEKKNCLVFDWNKLINNEKNLMLSKIKISVFEKISNFKKCLENDLYPSITQIQSRLAEIGLEHEMTRTVYNTIIKYLENLKSCNGIINVECFIINNVLSFRSDKIKEDLKAPIKELCRLKYVKISYDDIEDWEFSCELLVDNYLDSNKILQNPILNEYSDIILFDHDLEEIHEENGISYYIYWKELKQKLKNKNSYVISGPFYINTTKAISLIYERVEKKLKHAHDLLVTNFVQKATKIYDKLFIINKHLSFRSMKPELMLQNRFEVMNIKKDFLTDTVNELCDLFTIMHDLLDVLSYDGFDKVRMADIVSLRLQLPGKFLDHDMFFQRRLNIFYQFVKNQQTIMKNESSAVNEKLKILTTFSNPQEVKEYIKIIEELEPSLKKLLKNIETLNIYEKGVNFTKTKFYQIESLSNHIINIKKLYAITIEFQEYQETYWGRIRYNANIPEAKIKAEYFIEYINDLSLTLDNSKASKYFCNQLLQDIEKFKNSFDIIEILSSSRLQMRHWLKISDIIGFDITEYINSNVKELIKLNLNNFLHLLKPITFVAEREGIVNDQLLKLNTFWSSERIILEENGFWKLFLPVNLENIIHIASEHVKILESFIKNEKLEDMSKSPFSLQNQQWLKQLNEVLEITKKWNFCLMRWKKLGPIIKFNIKVLQKEFYNFRVCGKYFKLLQKYIEEESLVIKLKEGKHVKCWINLSEKHLNELMISFEKFLNSIRKSSIRLGLLSDMNLLILLQEQPLEEFLKNVKRLCFLNIKELKLNGSGKYLIVKSLDDQEIFINRDEISFLEYSNNLSLIDKILILENSINNKICELASSFTRKIDNKSILSNLEEERLIPRISRILYDRFSKKSSSEYAFNYLLTENKYLKLLSKGDRKEVPVVINFIPVVNFDKKYYNLSLNFASNWSQGKIPIIRGNSYNGRLIIQEIQFVTFADLHFINCHPFISDNAIYHILGCLKQHSTLVILENYDQLLPRIRYLLFNEICKIVTHDPCPNLVMISNITTKEENQFQGNFFIEFINNSFNVREHTNNSGILKTRNSPSQRTANTDSSNGKVQTPTSIPRRLSNFSSINGQQRNSITSIKSPKTIAENLITLIKPKKQQNIGKTPLKNYITHSRNSQRKYSTTSQSYSSNDSTKISFQDINRNTINNDNISKLNSISFIGHSSKSTLIEMMKSNNYLCKWIYFDTFTCYQLIHSNKEFGNDPEGYLIECLKKLDIEENKDGKFLIFCGRRHFNDHFPFISSLFTKNISVNIEKEKNTNIIDDNDSIISSGSNNINNNENKGFFIPPPYLTLPDGSNYIVNDDIKILLCLPGVLDINKSDIEWIRRCEVQSIILEGMSDHSLVDVWIENNDKINDIISSSSSYMEVISSTFEYLIQPLWNFVSPSFYVSPSLLMEYIMEELKQNMKNINSNNYGEILRFTILSLSMNYLIIYYPFSNDLNLLNNFIHEIYEEAENNFLVGIKIPSMIIDFKISNYDFNKWVEWKNEITYKTVIDKDISLSEIIITYPHLDRLLTYCIRSFRNKHLLIFGDRCCGKSTFIKRMTKIFKDDGMKYKVIWLDTCDRNNLIKIQIKFFKIIEDVEKNDGNFETVIIIDNFSFNEYIISLIELFLDQYLIILPNGKTKKYNTIGEKVKFILILQDQKEVINIKKYDMFHEKFYILPLRYLRKEEIEEILINLFEYHLELKSFSSEYQSFIVSLSKATIDILNIKDILLIKFIKIIKGIMFSYPETAPDLDSFCRLWIHEIIRVCYDSIDNKIEKENLIKKIENALSKYYSSSFEILFEKTNNDIDEDIYNFNYLKDDLNYQGTIVKNNKKKIFKIDSLLYTEVSNGIDVIEGIPYGILYNTNDFTSHMSNLVYELYRSNNIKKPMNLIINEYIANQCQRIMRISRMSNEHMVIVGEVGSGRRSCVKLSNFALVGYIEYIYISTSSIESFEESWRNGINKIIESVASSNVITTLLFIFDDNIKKIPLHNFLMIKQWFESYDIMEFLSEDMLLKLGEKIVEAEKGLATQEQGSNIRLPGQRKPRFLPIEAMKDLDILKYTLSQRFSDLTHGIFLVPPGYENLFSWCSINYFSPINLPDISSILGRQLQDLVKKEYDNNILINIIKKICDETEELINGIHTNNLKKLYNVNMRNHFQLTSTFVQVFNKKYLKLHGMYKTFETAIGTMKIINELSTIGGDIDNEELEKDLENEELSYLMLSRERNKKRDEYNEIEDILEKLNKEKAESLNEVVKYQMKIKEKLEEPNELLENVKKSLVTFNWNDFKKLSFLKKPSVIVRNVVDGIRMLVETKYKPSKNTINNWNGCQRFLRSKNLIDKLINFNTTAVDDKLLGGVKRYSEVKLYRINQIVDENKLAFILCKWLIGVIHYVEIDKGLGDDKNVFFRLNDNIKNLNIKIEKLVIEKEIVNKRLEYLNYQVKECEFEVAKLRKQLDYRVRGSKVINNVYSIINNWKEKLTILCEILKNLIGNTLLYSSFYTLTSYLSSDVKLRALTIWKGILEVNGILYNEKYTDNDYFLRESFIEVSWKDKWPLITPEISKKENSLFVSQSELLKNKILKFYPKAYVIDFNSIDKNQEEFDKKIVNISLHSINTISNGNKNVEKEDNNNNEMMLESLWNKKSLIVDTLKALRNGNELILMNIPCSPPVSWSNLIEREIDVIMLQEDNIKKKDEENKKNIYNIQAEVILQFPYKKVAVNKKFKLFIICEKDINLIDISFLRKIWPVTINEGMDLQQSSNYTLEEEVIENLINEDEEFLLKKMNDYSSNDILESHELTEQVIHHGRSYFSHQNSRTF
uniref:Dynein heavy chain n=1 Tax=Parastrongyloides trichosuri TaxID=131310 RepID=A0A0N4ZFA2_PARTI